MATKIAAIPSPTDANLKEVARALKNVLDVREGYTGDPLDSNVTFRDLVDGGIINVSVVKRGGGSGIGDVTPVDDDAYDPTKDLSIPPAPTGLIANGLFAAIALSWDNPPQSFRNHAYTEVWRSATDAVGSAIRVAAVTNNAFIDYLGSNETRYYWVRFVSQADIIGPWNATAGTSATTSVNPGVLLDSLVEAITATELDQTLTSRIDLIDGPSSLTGSVNARILAETNARIAALAAEAALRDSADDLLQSQIDALSGGQGGDLSGLISALNQEIADRIAGDLAEANARFLGDQENAAAIGLEEDARVDADGALATQVSYVGTAFGQSTAAIIVEKDARSTADSASASQITTIGAATSTAIGGITQEQSARASGDSAQANQISAMVAMSSAAGASIKSEEQVRADATSALAAQTTIIGASMGQNAAAIFEEQRTRADQNSALTAQSTILGAQVGQNTAALAVEQVARADSDSASARLLSSLTAAAGNSAAAITDEQRVRADSTGALANQFSSITVSTGGNSAAIYAESDARTTADASQVARLSGISSVTQGNTAALTTEATARTNADSAAASQINSLIATSGTSAAAITEEQRVRADSTSALANTFAATTASTGANSAALYAEQNARTTLDSARASLITGITSVAGGNTAAIASESTTRADSDSAAARVLSGITSATGSNRAAIVAEQTTRTTENSATATQISQLSASVGSNSAAISTEQSVRANQTGELYAQYTVKLDTNGYVSGFGLASTASNTGTSSSIFGIRADRFYIGSPTLSATPNDSSSIIPFVVQTTAGTASNGTAIPPGVYMDAAYIKNATITAAKIGGVYADTVTAGYMSTVDLTGSTIVGSDLYIGGTVAYEYNDPARPTQITGIASVTSPKVALKAGVGGYAEFAVDAFLLKSSAAATASTVFSVINGNVVLNADKVYATTLSAITANLGTVNAGVVQSTDGKAKFDLNNARIVFNNGTYMKVVGNGFGANSDFLEWFGPTQAETSNFAACTTANAFSYVKTAAALSGLTTGTIAFMRGLRIGDHNGNIVLDAGTGTYADAIRNGAITVDGNGVLSGIGTSNIVVDNSYNPIGVNLVPNSDFAVVQDPWDKGWVQDGGTDITVQRDLLNGAAATAPTGGHNLGLLRGDGDVATGATNALTGIIDLRINDASRIPILPSTRYELSAYVASVRCDCDIRVWFYDSTGTYITETGVQPTRTAPSTNLASWARPYLFVTSPSNARTALVGIRIYAVDSLQVSGAAWVTKMFFGQANTNQASPSPWSPTAYTENIKLNPDGTLYGAGTGSVAPFEPYHGGMWDFRGSLGPWTALNATLSVGTDTLVMTGNATNNNPYLRILNGGMSVNGGLYNKIRVRYRRTSGSGAWDGLVYYSTAAHTSFSASYQKAIGPPEPTIVNNQWYISEWDMENLTAGGTDWVTSTITGLRIDFATGLNEVWEVDWVVIGRYGAGEWTTSTINPTNQLGAGNIGTYVANLAVGTLHMGANAVTVPNSATSSTTTFLNTATWTNLVSVSFSITAVGLTSVDTAIPIIISWAVEANIQNSGAQVRQWRVLRDVGGVQTAIYTSSASLLDTEQFSSGVVRTTMDAGSTVTWYLQGKGVASVPVYQSSMWVIAARR